MIHTLDAILRLHVEFGGLSLDWSNRVQSLDMSKIVNATSERTPLADFRLLKTEQKVISIFWKHWLSIYVYLTQCYVIEIYTVHTSTDYIHKQVLGYPSAIHNNPAQILTSK